MQRQLLVLLITTGAISLSGCGFFNRNSDVAEEPTTPTDPVVQPLETAEGDLPNLPEGGDADSVVVASPNPPTTVVARDLIQSTDPNERTIGVERTRTDPFAGLTIPLVPPQPIEAETAAGAGGVQTSPGAASPATANGATPANAAGPESRQSPLGPPEIAALPEIPQPTTARAVRVSGVVQIGGSPYAIVQAPNDVERYVRTGESLAGGRVLVKRIDTRSVEPRVILVENGIEVERLVTEAQTAAAPEEAPPPPAETVSTLNMLPELPSPGI
ncbi:MAG: hypothetical protein AAGI45_08725 [Cyanobacteria bacterium P01_H01_bin.26]